MMGVINMKISKQSAEHYIWGDNCDGWHLVKKQNSSIIHERMPANSSEVKHYHQHASQFFFVLSGTATMEIGDKEVVLNQQEGIEVSPLTPHQMFNKSNDEVEFLVISQPNSKGDRIVVD
jgi:mannose-6-phosphate isomerase-like protein (cupin superfamily)